MAPQMMVALMAMAGLFGSVDGNGKLKEELREVPEFHAIHVGGGIQGTVTLGVKASVKVEADENLLPHIRTRVEGGELVVDTKESISPTRPVKLTVVVTRLDGAGVSGGARLTAAASAGPKFAVKASGGAKLEVTGIASDECAVDTSGGSSVTLSGKAKKVLVETSGGSHLTATSLSAESARLDTSGASRVELDVSGDAVGEASGASRVSFKGQPQKKQIETSGAARVE
ncbi:MAG: head GIN domain-containing protein [Myxococcales bacterium]